MKDKIMRNILTFSILALLAALTSCSTDENLDGVTPVEGKSGTSASIPGVVLGDASRSALYYEDGSLRFVWNNGDGIAVYPKFADAEAQGFPSADKSPRLDMMYVLDSSSEDGSPVDENGYITGWFGLTDEETVVLNLPGTNEYYAWSPNVSDRTSIATPTTGYLAMPVDLTGQMQAKNVEISHFGVDNAAYKASEKEASEHLGDYDFMYSLAAQGGNGQTSFKFKHVPGFVRFYMKVPEPDVEQVFDSLLLFRKAEGLAQYRFTTKGTFNMETEKITRTEQPSVLKLLLGTSGFDLIDHDVDSERYGKTSDLYKRGNNYIMIAYMAVAPVNLNIDALPKPVLYLCSHKGTGDEMAKKYYRATLAKKNIKAGYLYQWASELDEEEPITFEEIEVEEWKAEMGYINTVTDGNTGKDKEGAGTENW